MPNSPMRCRPSRCAKPWTSARSAPSSKSGSAMTSRSASASTKSNPSVTGLLKGRRMTHVMTDNRSRHTNCPPPHRTRSWPASPRGQDQSVHDRPVRLLGMHVVLPRHGRAAPVRCSTKITIHRSLAHRYQKNHRTLRDRIHRGGVANEDNIETLRHFRDNCDILISVGACAIWGGVPAMRNMFELKDCLSEAYINSPTAVPGAEPVMPVPSGYPPTHHQGVPLPRSGQDGLLHSRLSTGADAIFTVLDDLINGRPVDCPAR